MEGELRILVVCTANVCRSPMAAAFLQEALAEVGVAAAVTSAGTRAYDLSVDPVAVEVMAGWGLDISGHQPRAVDREVLSVDGSSLVVTMTREHLRDVVVADRSTWRRTFTFRELVRRAEREAEAGDGGALMAWASWAEWVGRLGEGRQPRDLLGDDPDDDVADPYGRGPAAVRRTAGELRDLARRLALVGVWGPPGRR